MNLRTGLVLLLAFALLGWFLRNADLGLVWSHVRGARIDLLVLAVVLSVSIYWVRALRWQFLLAPLGPTRFRTAFRTTVIGFAALAVLPARAGDLLRPYLLARQEGLSPPATFATVVFERVLDLVAVLALLAVFVWGFDGAAALPPSVVRPIEASAAIAGAAAVALLVLMWTLATHPERVGRLVYLAARVLPRRMAKQLGALASTFSSGFAAARDPKALALATFWSFPLWVILCFETWLVTVALGIEMPFSGTFLLQALLVLGVAVPTPGGVGSFHEAYRWGVTTLFNAPNDRAVAAALVTHTLSYAPVIVLGFVFMLQDGLSVRRLTALAGEARQGTP